MYRLSFSLFSFSLGGGGVHFPIDISDTHTSILFLGNVTLAPPDVVKDDSLQSERKRNFYFFFRKIIITPFGKKKKRAVMSDMTGRKDNHHLDFSMCQVVVASLSKYTDNGTTHIHNVCWTRRSEPSGFFFFVCPTVWCTGGRK